MLNSSFIFRHIPWVMEGIVSSPELLMIIFLTLENSWCWNVIQPLISNWECNLVVAFWQGWCQWSLVVRGQQSRISGYEYNKALRGERYNTAGSGQWLAGSYGTIMLMKALRTVATQHTACGTHPVQQSLSEWWGNVNTWKEHELDWIKNVFHTRHQFL